MNIYVGNLSFKMTEDDLRVAFEAYGQVASVKIINDRETGRPRGFAFVEMANDTEAKAAIEGLNGKDYQGRTITVNEARPREERGPKGGGERAGGGRSSGPGGGGGRDRRW
jgi:RNA recognition motif-containing protein